MSATYSTLVTYGHLIGFDAIVGSRQHLALIRLIVSSHDCNDT